MDLKAAASELQDRIFHEDYYKANWVETLFQNDATQLQIQYKELDDEKIVLIVNDFWELLPDDPSIRRGPFFLACEIAEHIFN